MGMSQGLEYLNFAIKILSQLPVKAFEIDRLDGYGGFAFLYFRKGLVSIIGQICKPLMMADIPGASPCRPEQSYLSQFPCR